MKVQSVFFLLGLVLAGSHIIAPPPALMSTLRERIEFADIEALIKSDNANELKAIIDSNTQILKNSVSVIYRNEAFNLAVNQNSASVIALFLKELSVNAASDQNNLAIRVASARGHTDIVRMLLERPEVNPGAGDNEAIRLSSGHGYTDIVGMLLKRPQVNPGARDNEALVNAVRNGRTKIFQLLLADSRVDPSARSNLPFRFAVYNARTDLVKLLLADKRVNPTDPNNAAILSMNLGYGPSFNHRYDTLKLLLEDGRADPSVNNNQILSRLRNFEALPTIELLEQDDRVKAIEFLNSETDRLTTTTFLNLFNSQLKWNTASFIESVFAERPNALVASYISNLLEISLREAKAIKNLDDFDKYIYKMHKDIVNHRIRQEAPSNQETTLLQRKFEFLMRYYGATIGYKDHFRRFQELMVSFGKNH